jgi:hypothetical protein
MAEPEGIRLEALKGLTILALNDDQFRRGAVEDLDGTLGRYGYDLTDQEMERLRRAVQEEITGWSDEDLVRHMREGEESLRILEADEESVVTPQDYVDRCWM